MAQSTLHVAIIMDGNGRWAAARGLQRTAGHRAGVEAVRRIVRAAPALGIGTLTLFAFSSDNWRRPSREVASLMQVLRRYLGVEAARCAANGIRITVIGRRDRIPSSLRRAVEAAEAATAHGRVLHLRIAVDYSSRDEILRAAGRANVLGHVSRESFSRLLADGNPSAEPAPDVDLLIRTGGEQRLSDFLLWESAYAELFFAKRPWPDFDAADLEAAVREFYARERRFGRLSENSSNEVRFGKVCPGGPSVASPQNCATSCDEY